jgi:hypothetical protein
VVRPCTARLATRAKHGQDPEPKEFTFAGDDLKSPAIDVGNFLIKNSTPGNSTARPSATCAASNPEAKPATPEPSRPANQRSRSPAARLVASAR